MTLGLTHLYSGKVRDLYDAGDNHVLMVASDRLSAFDVVMNETIPEKGRVLTALTNYWLRECGMTVPSSLVSCDPDVIERHVPGFASERAWHGRSMLVRRAVINDSNYEGQEDFKLIVRNTGGKDASGNSSIIDNGT